MKNMLLDLLKFIGIILAIALVTLLIITRKPVYSSEPFSNLIASKISFKTTKINSSSGSFSYTLEKTINNSKTNKIDNRCFSGSKTFSFMCKDFLIDFNDTNTNEHNYIVSDKAGYYINYYHDSNGKCKNSFEYNPYTNVTYLGCNDFDYVLLQFFKYYASGSPINKKLNSNIRYEGIQKVDGEKFHVLKCDISKDLEKYLVGYKGELQQSGTITYYADLFSFEIKQFTIECDSDVLNDDNNIFIETKEQLKKNKELSVSHYKLDCTVNFTDSNKVKAISVPGDLLDTKVRYSKFSNKDYKLKDRKALLEDSYAYYCPCGIINDFSGENKYKAKLNALNNKQSEKEQK